LFLEEDEKQFPKSKNIDMIVLYRSLNILKKNIPNIPNLFPNSTSNKEQDTENIIYQRFEHIEKENNLKNNIKQLNEEIKNNKKIRNEILSKLKILENKINDIEYNVNMLKNVNRFTMIEKEQIEMRNEIKRRKELIREKPKTRTLRLKPDIIEDNEEDDDDKNEKIIFGYFQSRINTMLNKNRINDENQLNLKLLRASQSREKKIEKIQDNLQKLYEKRKSLLKELNIILNNIENLKNSKHEKINILYMHYLKLLKSGIDTRSEGLSWIIKEIFALNKNVLMSYLPNFLDEECIKFIFKQANISIKLNEFDKEIHKKQEELFNLGINNSFNIGKNRKNSK
jgi:septal ring factor EnvC (AmiA/AmiB activator)